MVRTIQHWQGLAFSNLPQPLFLHSSPAHRLYQSLEWFKWIKETHCFEQIFSYLWKSCLFHPMPEFLFVVIMLKALISLQFGDGKQQRAHAQPGTGLWSLAGYRLLLCSGNGSPHASSSCKILWTVLQLHKPHFRYELLCSVKEQKEGAKVETTGSHWLMVLSLNFTWELAPVICFSYVLWQSQLSQKLSEGSSHKKSPYFEDVAK